MVQTSVKLLWAHSKTTFETFLGCLRNISSTSLYARFSISEWLFVHIRATSWVSDLMIYPIHNFSEIICWTTPKFLALFRLFWSLTRFFSSAVVTTVSDEHARFNQLTLPSMLHSPFRPFSPLLTPSHPSPWLICHADSRVSMWCPWGEKRMRPNPPSYRPSPLVRKYVMLEFLNLIFLSRFKLYWIWSDSILMKISSLYPFRVSFFLLCCEIDRWLLAGQQIHRDLEVMQRFFRLYSDKLIDGGLKVSAEFQTDPAMEELQVSGCNNLQKFSATLCQYPRVLFRVTIGLPVCFLGY